jgi:hypothetical protein
MDRRTVQLGTSKSANASLHDRMRTHDSLTLGQLLPQPMVDPFLPYLILTGPAESREMRWSEPSKRRGRRTARRMRLRREFFGWEQVDSLWDRRVECGLRPRRRLVEWQASRRADGWLASGTGLGKRDR